ncbi:hypothetical protein OsJ_29005 [Oryza sativa Japonica Group]|uniref:Malectin-like domain-containing protein n=1 Tax=Oryza sativa subsp. japonica TaxID=39947 RepID=B9G335_ORYSJ|nr:hypothetical protein OsJ_29005 [Oryza sativa Japonica Group]
MAPYVDTGENHRLLPGEEGQRERRYLTVRSFPSGVRNCYSLPTVAGAKYLVRVASYSTCTSGRPTGRDTVSNSSYWFREAMFVAWASWVPVCLVNTGRGTPFVSAVELRPLGGELYPALNAIQSQSMRLVQRTNMGPSKSRILRYPDDPYDRRWLRMQLDRTWKNLSTASTIKDTSLDYAVPLPVMQTAAEAVSNETSLAITGEYKAPMGQLEVFMHFADFQNSQIRQFSISFNKKASVQMRPSYLATDTLHSTYKATGGVCTMTLTSTSESTLRPMLNAFEVYSVIPRDNPMTFPRDCNNVVGEGLNWRTRVRVVVEAAQERVCDLFSRVKCRDWEPKYFYTGRLTESSDVYSFGVVLLEIAIGESPILPELSHIVHRVKNKIATGNISLVADTRLRGSYEVSSMWKVVDTALLCTTDIGTQRPTMAAVVALLKESLALEETRADSTFSGATGTASASTTSSMNFGPLARRS